MMGVRKRLIAIVLLLATATAGCAGSSDAALSAGDSSITWEGLDDLVLGLNQDQLPDGDPQTFSADSYRRIAEVWLQNAVLLDILDAQGVEFTDIDRDAARDLIEGSIRDGSIPPIPQSSEAYDALLTSAWLSQPVLTDQFRSADGAALIIEEYRSAEVSSRLGIFDRETGRILPHSVAGQ